MDEIYSLVAVFVVAFVATFGLTRKFILRFHAGGYVVSDMYKPDKHDVPTMGGIAILGGVMVSLIVAQLLIESHEFVEKLLIFYFIVFIYGVFGLLDDLIKIKSRWKRVYIPLFLALPIALLNTGEYITFSPLDFQLYVGWLKPYVIAPLYVMVVANMVNMHAGFNGLSGGLSWILMFFVGLKVVLDGNVSQLNYLMPIFGSLLAFMWYNKYPSRIFLGNSGTMITGVAVGGLLVLYNMEIFGLVILLPHIFNFLLWIYWLMNMHVHPHVKFARLREDGTIEPPNKLTLKYIVTHYFRVGELRAILILYGITTVFGIIGLLSM
ncbi:MAG: hypothetical protein V1921_07770 [Candidatus Altiarchaeota archaeon]